MNRKLATFVSLVAAVSLLATACGGGGDDDDDDSGDDDSGDSDDVGRTDSSNATGTLTLDGKDYKIDMETCQIKGQGDLTVFAGSLEGDKDGEFSASGLDDSVAIAVSLGDSAYISVGEKVKIDGKSVSYDGDAVNPADPGKSVKLKFAFKC